MRLTRYNIRVANCHAGQLVDLSRTGGLIPEAGSLSGMRGGQIYRPAATTQSALHDGLLLIGGVCLRTELYRLPLTEHQALIAASPTYETYPGTVERVNALMSPLTAAEQRAWLDDLAESVQQGRLLTAGLAGDIVWQPEGTRLVQLGHLWFVNLAFAVPQLGKPKSASRVHLGIDVGLRPLAVAVSARDAFQPGYVQRLGELDEHVANLPASLQAEVQAELEKAQHAAARLSLARFTAQVLDTACTVTVEALDLKTFASDFVVQGRREAVIDWHQSWLPQALYAVDLPPLTRVRPHGTSQYCSWCRRKGTRDRARFTCPRCGEQDAHVNAGRNLLNRGWSERRARAQGRR